jgi:hypothetical protein
VYPPEVATTEIPLTVCGATEATLLIQSPYSIVRKKKSEKKFTSAPNSMTSFPNLKATPLVQLMVGGI